MTGAFRGRAGTGRRGTARCLAWLSLLCALAPLPGCGARPGHAVPLTLLSPHRDEIRQEFALAFRDWMGQRTARQVDGASVALREWLDRPDAGRRSAVERAFNDLFEPWEEAEQHPLRAAFGEWRQRPAPDTGRALLAALGAWGGHPPPVELVWQDVGGGTSQIVRFVASRFRDHPDGIGVDLLFGGGTDNFLRFADQGWLQKVDIPPAVLGRIPPDLNGVPLYDPQGRWYGPMVSGFGILVNKRVLERIGQPAPARWADLGAPGLRDWVGAGDPRVSGSVHMVYEIILQRPTVPPGRRWEEGVRVLMRLGANAHSFIADSGVLTRTVATGEVTAAGNIDVNALSAVGLDPEGLVFRLPPGETVINPDAIAVLKGAPHPGLARAFVEFTLSDAGQKLILLRPGVPGGPQRYPLCRLSVVKQLYEEHPPEERSVGAVDPFAAGHTFRYDNRLGIRRWDALNDLFGAWVVDARPELASAWQGVLRLPPGELRDRLEEELFRPPCGEAELDAYAGQVAAGSPRVRTEAVTRWGEEARRRYRRVRREALSP